MSDFLNRRNFIKQTAMLISGTVLASTTLIANPLKHFEQKEDISPNEDLMREHGVLRRILLIYREGILRIDQKKELNPASIHEAASIIREFIEGYHEELEEHFLFPRFEKAGQLTNLVGILKQQHTAGRTLTKRIIELSSSKPTYSNHERQLASAMQEFITMYEPHAAREDTVLFPALHRILSEAQYQELGEQFEDEEHKRFGEKGFENILFQVASIEKALGIYDLAQFTPKV
ncbi:hemerythrin domain-containing protein [Legionella jordanis]|uniref:Hemerythrin HHE cation binding domain protein n=1 Tax=Legionella jordanis TaxID=456 RepID=A0A0W0VAQ3_9GAMM|nr:hemerythrin domain-containing protein [Legionella jordanis]KTD17239.1 Hemerythrin HHE cation binding domain protein [Legionella jordanis]RMX03354.1 hemerythrin domain-containing protein [Legionella jordanis]RMX15832.1 hemerythrin domain-containing protein [Legionella jordanis]VEH12563.1 Uncharacterized conserved protein [Legionella jordanis]HAT8713362.1 hemerythrin domain-containing protein [Legionella jordanis]